MSQAEFDLRGVDDPTDDEMDLLLLAVHRGKWGHLADSQEMTPHERYIAMRVLTGVCDTLSEIAEKRKALP